ncbi:hypothetical protein RFI_06014 [Reticulomyxa filosa]|uniref:SAM-dependent MTase RsmB/NOP-type domain-containing protein n=1 Tax=Reticulomyxa filosa TaxID=46433 RepID=X6NYZ6_RETFI|nr:hypothetical protein RFI_06014 [Reticulomyxa filosa]|eukprot:ETO31108.1 hypothetical protein RFI_06014 [Reticulomyxa filosa]
MNQSIYALCCETIKCELSCLLFDKKINKEEINQTNRQACPRRSVEETRISIGEKTKKGRKQKKDEALLLILLFELLLSSKKDEFNKKLKSGKPKKTQHKLFQMLSTQCNALHSQLVRLKIQHHATSNEQLLHCLSPHTPSSSHADSASVIYRYARVNTVRLSLSECIHVLESKYGFTFCKCPRQMNVLTAEFVTSLHMRVCVYVCVCILHDGCIFCDCDRCKCAKSEDKLFWCDEHIPNLLVFHHDASQELAMSNIVTKDNELILQDKASCFSAHCLLQDGALGTEFFRRCQTKKRHALLTKRLSGFFPGEVASTWTHGYDDATSKHRIVTKCADFLTIDPAKDPLATQIKYFSAPFCICSCCVTLSLFLPVDQTNSAILLDPTCSGSGLLRHQTGHYLDNDNTNAKETKIQLICQSQFELLSHACQFPNVDKIVYSTCSIDERENEQVVDKVLSKFGNIFHCVNILPKWKTRGLTHYSFGQKCVRCDPYKDGLHGFFVSCLIRKKELCEETDNDLYTIAKFLEEDEEEIASDSKKRTYSKMIRKYHLMLVHEMNRNNCCKMLNIIINSLFIEINILYSG